MKPLTMGNIVAFGCFRLRATESNLFYFDLCLKVYLCINKKQSVQKYLNL